MLLSAMRLAVCTGSCLISIATISPGGQSPPRTTVDRTRFGDGATAVAADSQSSGADQSPSGTAQGPGGPAPSRPVPAREVLETQFEEALTGAVLEGIWQVTGKNGLRSDEPLSEPRTERYTIASAKKVDGEHWVIGARIEFGEVDVTVPVPVRVLWAGDTPVITLDDLNVPMIGEYSARVMIHNGFYSGVWYSNAKNYGGILTGRIVKPSPEPQDDSPPPTEAPDAPAPEKPDRHER